MSDDLFKLTLKGVTAPEDGGDLPYQNEPEVDYKRPMSPEQEEIISQTAPAPNDEFTGRNLTRYMREGAERLKALQSGDPTMAGWLKAMLKSNDRDYFNTWTRRSVEPRRVIELTADVDGRSDITQSRLDNYNPNSQGAFEVWDIKLSLVSWFMTLIKQGAHVEHHAVGGSDEQVHRHTQYWSTYNLNITRLMLSEDPWTLIAIYPDSGWNLSNSRHVELFGDIYQNVISIMDPREQASLNRQMYHTLCELVFNSPVTAEYEKPLKVNQNNRAYTGELKTAIVKHVTDAATKLKRDTLYSTAMLLSTLTNVFLEIIRGERDREVLALDEPRKTGFHLYAETYNDVDLVCTAVNHPGPQVSYIGPDSGWDQENESHRALFSDMLDRALGLIKTEFKVKYNQRFEMRDNVLEHFNNNFVICLGYLRLHYTEALPNQEDAEKDGRGRYWTPWNDFEGDTLNWVSNAVPIPGLGADFDGNTWGPEHFVDLDICNAYQHRPPTLSGTLEGGFKRGDMITYAALSNKSEYIRRPWRERTPGDKHTAPVVAMLEQAHDELESIAPRLNTEDKQIMDSALNSLNVVKASLRALQQLLANPPVDITLDQSEEDGS